MLKGSHVLTGGVSDYASAVFSVSLAPDFEILCESSLQSIMHSIYLFKFVIDVV